MFLKILKRKRAYKERGSIKMNSLLIMNWLAAIAVIAYAGYLFVYLIRTRMAYIQLGKKIEFDRRFKERWDLLKVNVFGQKKLLKDKKSGIIHVMFFTDLFLSNLEQLTSFGKDSHQDHIFHLDHYTLHLHSSRKLSHLLF